MHAATLAATHVLEIPIDAPARYLAGNRSLPRMGWRPRYIFETEEQRQQARQLLVNQISVRIAFVLPAVQSRAHTVHAALSDFLEVPAGSTLEQACPRMKVCQKIQSVHDAACLAMIMSAPCVGCCGHPTTGP